jgi:hypothetical protein
MAFCMHPNVMLQNTVSSIDLILHSFSREFFISCPDFYKKLKYYKMMAGYVKSLSPSNVGLIVQQKGYLSSSEKANAKMTAVVSNGATLAEYKIKKNKDYNKALSNLIKKYAENMSSTNNVSGGAKKKKSIFKGTDPDFDDDFDDEFGDIGFLSNTLSLDDGEAELIVLLIKLGIICVPGLVYFGIIVPSAFIYKKVRGMIVPPIVDAINKTRKAYDYDFVNVLIATIVFGIDGHPSLVKQKNGMIKVDYDALNKKENIKKLTAFDVKKLPFIIGFLVKMIASSMLGSMYLKDMMLKLFMKTFPSSKERRYAPLFLSGAFDFKNQIDAIANKSCKENKAILLSPSYYLKVYDGILEQLAVLESKGFVNHQHPTYQLIKNIVSNARHVILRVQPGASRPIYARGEEHNAAVQYISDWLTRQQPYFMNEALSEKSLAAGLKYITYKQVMTEEVKSILALNPSLDEVMNLLFNKVVIQKDANTNLKEYFLEILTSYSAADFKMPQWWYDRKQQNAQRKAELLAKQEARKAAKQAEAEAQKEAKKAAKAAAKKRSMK